MTSHGHYVCKSCGSESHGKFGGELGLHFQGLRGLDKPIVFVFPDVVVCLSCGHAEFTVPETELRVLQSNTPTENAAILLSSSGASNQQSQPHTEIKPLATPTQETVPPKHRKKRRR